MPKKTVSSSKKTSSASSARKASVKAGATNSVSKAKRTGTKKAGFRKTTKKPKVYIPAYKALLLCAGVIAVCVLLLLGVNIAQEKKTSKNTTPSITKRFEDEKLASKKSSEKEASVKQKKDSSQKNTEKKSSENSDTDSSTTSKSINSSAEKSAPTNSTSANSANSASTSSSSEKPAITTSPTTNSQASSKNSDSITSNSQKTTGNTYSSSTEIASIKTDSKNVTKTENQQDTAKKFNFPKAVNNAQLVFVFDDGGQNLSHLEKFFELPFPFTVAVLPRIAHSKESADRIRKSGNEVMLHQPMQAVNEKINPGPGAITPQMSENQIISTLFQNITEIGPIEGMNNHEGSLITADAEKMAVILKAASENGIYFLDSRTNVETKVPYVAHELGYSWYERNIFLDNNFQENKFKDNKATRDNFLTELNKGLAIANKNGSVIMIGHIWSAEILPKYIKEVYPELVEKGYTFSVVSKSKAKKW